MTIKDSNGKAFRITVKRDEIVLNIPVTASKDEYNLWIKYGNIVSDLLKDFSVTKTLRGETKDLSFYYLRLNSKIQTKRTCEFTVNFRNNTIIKGKYKDFK